MSSPQTTNIVAAAPEKVKKQPKVKKVKKVQNPSRLKVNANQGIYISASRTKYWLDSNGLNKDIEMAISELRHAEPHEEESTDPITKEKTKKTTVLVRICDLSKETQRQLELAKKNFSDKQNLEKEKDVRDKAEALKDPVLAEKLKKRQDEAKTKQAEKDARDAKDPPKAPTAYATEIELLGKGKVRFAKDTALYVSSYICSSIHQLVEFGMAKVLESNRKIFKLKYALAPGHENLSLSCIYRNLPEFKQALAEEEKIKAAIALKKAELLKVACTTKVEEAKVAAPAAVLSDDDEEEEDDDGRNFKHYVRQICYDVMNTKILAGKPEYANIRVSKEIRAFLSDVIVGIIKLLCPLVEGQIKLKNVSTVSEDIVDYIFNVMLRIYGIQVEPVVVEHRAKIKTHDAYIEQRKKDKEAAEAARVAAKAAAPAVAPVVPAPAQGQAPAGAMA